MLPIIKKGIEKIVYGFGFGFGMGVSFKLIPVSRDNYPKDRQVSTQSFEEQSLIKESMYLKPKFSHLK